MKAAAARSVDVSAPVQRTVAAVNTRPPETTAQRSAFDNKPKRRPEGVPALDPAAVQIQSGEPMPRRVRGGSGGGRAGALLARMAPGDSVVVLHVHARSLIARARKLGIKAELRKLSDEQSGVWRLS